MVNDPAQMTMEFRSGFGSVGMGGGGLLLCTRIQLYLYTARWLHHKMPHLKMQKNSCFLPLRVHLKLCLQYDYVAQVS